MPEVRPDGDHAARLTHRLKRLIIGAPFGNYLAHPAAESTLGTYTVENRAGFLRWWLLWRVALTLRPYRKIGAWVNKLGLPNPGIKHLRDLTVEKPDSWTDNKIVSIHGFNDAEWVHLLEQCRHSMYQAVELNVSCPNVGELSVPRNLFVRALATLRSPVIVKLPPVDYWETYKLALASGVTIFHCTNTLPTPSGGLSGKPLKRVALDVIARIKNHDPSVTVIGGGGITGPDDVNDFHRVGADHFAVASTLLSPRLWLPWKRRALLDSINKRIIELKGSA